MKTFRDDHLHVIDRELPIGVARFIKYHCLFVARPEPGRLNLEWQIGLGSTTMREGDMLMGFDVKACFALILRPTLSSYEEIVLPTYRLVGYAFVSGLEGGSRRDNSGTVLPDEIWLE
jgi:hypothetical protein